MTHFGKNIRKIRNLKKLSQTGFAELFNMSRASIGAYEEGRAEPKTEAIIEIAKYFSISVDTLLTREMTVNDLLKFNEPEPPADGTKQHPEVRGVTIPYISEMERPAYLLSHKDSSYIAELPQIMLPFSARLIMRAFENTGDEMVSGKAGIHHGDIAVCSISGFNKIKSGTICTVVTADKIRIRRIEKRGGSLILMPDNPQYSPVETEKTSVKEIWEVKALCSFTLSLAPASDDRMLRVETELKALNEKVRKMIGKHGKG